MSTDHLTQAIQEKQGLKGISGKLTEDEYDRFMSACKTLGLNKTKAASAVLRDGISRLEAEAAAKVAKGEEPEDEPDDSDDDPDDDSDDDSPVEPADGDDEDGDPF